MKKFKKIAFLVLFLIIIILSFTIYTNASRNNENDIREKSLSEIKYVESKLINLFNSLNKNTHFVEIMGYRAIDLSKIKDKEEKARYKKLKRLYNLSDMRTEEEKENDFANEFL